MINQSQVNKPLLIFAGITVVIVIALTIYRNFFMPAPLIQTPESSPAVVEEEVLCSQDVKYCPNGTFVSRVPPSCEFAECPIDTTENESSDSADLQEDYIE